MSTPLLRTKLYIPPVQPNLVPRPRLIERLNAGLHRKLTLISAPAGFGKTSLLGEWSQQSEHPIAWLSLDREDNDPSRFWAYVIAALRLIQPDVGDTVLAALQSPHPTPTEAILTNLINEIAEIQDHFALVLDDFHMITAPEVCEGVSSFLSGQPAQMHLVLATRVDPPWPLARLRARGEVTELRRGDLRFTRSEVAAFLNGTMKLNLSAEHMTALEARTEGWVAGLQMAALSLQGGDERRVSEFVRSFTGSHRFILDYLMEEVLSQQAPDTQAFLLKTSILERMTASLCDAVLDEGDHNAPSWDSQTVLTQLDQANLFLVPLDNERCWYRYHHLFADLLRSRLRQAWPGEMALLHHRATKWYESKGLIVEAVAHAFAAGNMVQVADLIERNGLTMVGHGNLSTLLRWLETLPDELVRTRPWLSIARAWAVLFAGQQDATQASLQDAESSLEHLAEPGQITDIEGQIAAIRAGTAYIRGEMSHTVKLAQQALGRLPADDVMARNFASAHLGYALYWIGDLAAADQALSQAGNISYMTGDSHIALKVLCDLSQVQIDRGQLHKAVATLENAFQRADRFLKRGGQRLPSIGYAHTYMSRVLLEWNDLDEALRYARQGVELCKRWGQWGMLIGSHYSLAKALQAIGDIRGALGTIQEAGQLAADLSPWLVVRVAAWEAMIRLASGELDAADTWRRESGLSADDQLDIKKRFLYRALATVLIDLGRERSNPEYLGEALGLLSRLLEQAEAAGATGFVISTRVLQAAAHHAIGNSDQALIALKKALNLAEPENYVRTFIDEGEPMGQLLRQAVARGIAVTYASNLLAALEKDTGRHGRAVPASMVEPLSRRELEVLRLLTTHLPSTDIARELTVSLNTVRTHIKNIYSKLNVHSRNEAVQRAQELDLL